MPYTQGDFDKAMDVFIKEMVFQPKEVVAGEVNRMICRLYVQLIRSGIIGRYFDRAWFEGTVYNAMAEVYRREIAEYEDAAMARPGVEDVFEEE